MKKILIIIFVFLIHLESYSQSSRVYDSLILNRGIYKTIDEFLLNNPSISLDYNITSHQSGYGIFNSEGYVTYYYLEIDKDKGRSIGTVFGFCDGKNIYVNEQLPILSPKTSFCITIGNYFYFEDINWSSVGMDQFGYSSGSVSYKVEKFIDKRNKEILLLTLGSLRKILRNDVEILIEFDNQSNSKDHLKEYLFKYIEKNPDEGLKDIQFDSLATSTKKIAGFFGDNNIKINLDSLIYKSKEDLTFIDYYERIFLLDKISQQIDIKIINYNNGIRKSIGLITNTEASYKDDLYSDTKIKIGTWLFYDKDGKIEKIENYNMKGKKVNLDL